MPARPSRWRRGIRSGARAMPASWTRSAIPGSMLTPCRRKSNHEPLITARGIDDVLKLPAGFEALDLACHVFRYFVGIGIGCVVRRQDDLWMRPERAARRQRFRCEDIKRSSAQRAVIKAFQNVGFRLQPASPGIDQDRRTHRAISVEAFGPIPGLNGGGGWGAGGPGQ